MITQVKSGLRRLLPKSAFARGVSVLVGATTGAQVLSILGAPLVTRLYKPDDYGLLAVYTSLLALIGVVASLRYELAIPLPEDDQEAVNIAVLCLFLVAITSLLTGIFIFFLGQPIAQALSMPRLSNYFWLLPVGVLLSGTYTVFKYWGIRTKRFTAIAATRLRQAMATLLIQLAAFKFGGIALLFGHVAGKTVGTASLATPALAKPEFRHVTKHGLAEVAYRYRRFPTFTIWAGFVNTAGHQLPPLMFAAFFTASAVGLYALAHRILTLPASLIGTAIAEVFFSHAADAHRKGKLGEIYVKLQDKLIQIGLPPALILIIAGPKLFTVIFGLAWSEAGVFSQWLAVGVFAGFVVSPLSHIFVVLERQDVGFFLQFVLFLLRLVSILVGIWLDSLIVTVALFSLASLFGYSLYLVVGARYTKVGIHNLCLSLCQSVSCSAFLVIPLLLSRYCQDEFMFYLGLCITSAATLIRFAFIAKAAPFYAKKQGNRHSR